MERQREKLKTVEQEYVMYKGPLIQLCYRASFRNSVVSRALPLVSGSRDPVSHPCFGQLFVPTVPLNLMIVW